MVVQRAADIADRAAQRLRAALAHAPHLLDERFPGYEAARPGSERQQNLHGFRGQVSRPAAGEHLSLKGFNEHVVQVEPVQ